MQFPASNKEYILLNSLLLVTKNKIMTNIFKYDCASAAVVLQYGSVIHQVALVWS